ncbi:MAG: ABC transporter substrate-binding protein [Hyphomicrobiales bacterium]|nr:ABC transporter substrate-binding protein [Hyphomicrobiales bacterium]
MMMHTSLNKARIPGVAATAAVSAIFAVLAPQSARAAQGIDASVAYYPGALISLPAFVAKDKKFFEKNGLNVNLVPVNTGPAMTAAVASGSVTFVNNSWDNLIVAVEKGLPIRGVAGSTVRVPFALIARKGLALPHLSQGYPEVLKDIVGKKWGVVALGVSVQYLEQKLLTEAGYKANDATFVAVGLPATGRPALEHGTIDTYLSIEPLPTIVEDKGEGKVVLNLAANQGPKFFQGLGYNGWWASTSTIKDRPKVVAGFVKSMEQAYCWYSNPSHLDALVAIMRKYAKVPELSATEYKAMVKRLVPTFGPAIDARTIDTWSRLVIEQGQVTRPETRAGVIDAVAPETYSCSP